SFPLSFIHFSFFVLSIIFLFFLFYRFLIHRALHSFPTRRSSDLLNEDTSRTRDTGSPRSTVTGPELTPRVAVVVVAGARHFRRRSEEHTSELQSRFDLVCRLLLEKKNSQNSISS